MVKQWRRWCGTAVVMWLVVVARVWMPASGQGAIQIVRQDTATRYPYSVTFRLSAVSAAAPITEARLYWQAGPQDVFNVQLVAFNPARSVRLEVPLSTQLLSLPPFAQITYRWQIRDGQGNTLVTENETFEYADNRKDWQETANERLRMLWYGLDDALVAELFAAADQSYQQLAADFGVTLERRPLILLYPDRRAFEEFQDFVSNVEFVVGRYFPGHNIIACLITPDLPRELLTDTLAHELSHLYSDNYYVGYTRLPLWLEEGLATYHESADLSDELELVQRAAARQRLVPFIELPVAIRANNVQTANLAYAEGATVFAFIHEMWGQRSVVDFLSAFRRTTHVDTAMRNIFGLGMADFEIAWRAWLGYPVEQVPQAIPTPTLIPLLLPTPTYLPPGGS